MKTKQRITIRQCICVGLCATSLTALGDVVLCWHLVRPGKCGIECPWTYPDCIEVTCDSKKDCSLLSLDHTGTTNCPTMGCYCTAWQLTPVVRRSPNPEKPPDYACDLPKTITIAPPGCGGSDTTGILGNEVCTD